MSRRTSMRNTRGVSMYKLLCPMRPYEAASMSRSFHGLPLINYGQFIQNLAASNTACSGFKLLEARV